MWELAQGRPGTCRNSTLSRPINSASFDGSSAILALPSQPVFYEQTEQRKDKYGELVHVSHPESNFVSYI